MPLRDDETILELGVVESLKRINITASKTFDTMLGVWLSCSIFRYCLLTFTTGSTNVLNAATSTTTTEYDSEMLVHIYNLYNCDAGLPRMNQTRDADEDFCREFQ